MSGEGAQPARVVRLRRTTRAAEREAYQRALIVRNGERWVREHYAYLVEEWRWMIENGLVALAGVLIAGCAPTIPECARTSTLSYAPRLFSPVVMTLPRGDEVVLSGAEFERRGLRVPEGASVRAIVPHLIPAPSLGCRDARAIERALNQRRGDQ